ncbi:MAG: UvrB/UvrC motif-containing protein, partial [Muribaculaceae bacterium]|nr:UvrB/UvrC motif-containing protein [Muribaculaceae bacterium]
EHRVDVAADPVIGYMAPDELSVQIEKLNARMVAAAKRTDFIEAAQLRDEMLKLKDRLDSINSGSN